MREDSETQKSDLRIDSHPEPLVLPTIVASLESLIRQRAVFSTIDADSPYRNQVER